MEESELPTTEPDRLLAPAVGLRSIQSIMRLSTQSNLSSFHSAGISSVTRRSPSIRELLDYSKNMSCSTTFCFAKGTTASRALRSKPKLVQVPVNNLVERITCGKGKAFDDPTLEYYKSSLPFLSDVWITSLGDSERHWDMASLVEGNSFDHIDFHFSYMRLIENGLSMHQVVRSIAKAFSSNDSINFLYLPEPICIMRALKSRKSTITLWNITYLAKKILVGKRTNITSLALSVSTEGTIHAHAEGSDIQAIAEIPGVDITSISSNDIRDIEKTCGIDVARASIFSQLNAFHSDPKACNVIANIMTRSGSVRGFTKHSSEFTDPNSPLFMGFLTSAYVERSKGDIVESVAGRSHDEMISPYSSHIMGRKSGSKAD